MTQLHGPRSGDLVRARRRHHLPAGPPELRLHPDHGVEHGRAAPGRLPVGDGGQGARREGHPRRPALHAHERDGRPPRADPRRHATSPSSAGSINYILENDARVPASTCGTTPTRPVIINEDFEDTEDARAASSPAGTRSTAPTTSRPGATTGVDGEPPPASPSSRPTSPASRPTARTACELRTGEPPPRSTTTLRAPALRASRSCSATSRATRRRWSSEICGVPAGAVPAGRRGAVRELGPRAHLRDLLRGRLDAAHARRPEHPRRLDHPAAARQHRPPGRRHPRAARPREHPGLDRHPDALRHPAGLHPDAAPAVAADARRRSSRTTARNGRVGESQAPTWCRC